MFLLMLLCFLCWFCRCICCFFVVCAFIDAAVVDALRHLAAPVVFVIVVVVVVEHPARVGSRPAVDFRAFLITSFQTPLGASLDFTFAVVKQCRDDRFLPVHAFDMCTPSCRVSGLSYHQHFFSRGINMSGISGKFLRSSSLAAQSPGSNTRFTN